MQLDRGDELLARLAECCAAESWVAAVSAGFPFLDVRSLFEASDAATEALADLGLAQALAGHPRIGERPAGHGWSSQEQAGVSAADDGVKSELARANRDYEDRFGQVYLVCASGRSATELLAICRSRLGNDQVAERAVVLRELAKINRLRLQKLLEES